MKKVMTIIKNIITWCVIVAAVFMMIFTIVSVNTFDRANRSLFGYKAFIVLSDSMSATDFNAGDLVLVRQVDPRELKEGDIIAFTSQSVSSFGETVTHKIRARITDENGNPAFVTYGTTTGTDDETPVTFPFILGRYEHKLPKVGLFFNFLKTVPGYICCILVPFVILILIQLVNFIRIFRAYKKEQMDELQEERERLEEERRQSAEMMNELMALKAELAAQKELNASAKSEAEKDGEPVG